MSTNPSDTIQKIWNGDGKKYPTSQSMKRASLATVSIRGVLFDAEYFVDGAYQAATETDPVCYPSCDLKAVEVNGQDITRAIKDTRLWEEIIEAVEASWGAA